jgi:hypothetical protein
VLFSLLEAVTDYDKHPSGRHATCSFRTFLGALVRDRFRNSIRARRRWERRFDRSVRVEALSDERTAGGLGTRSRSNYATTARTTIQPAWRSGVS